MPSVRNRLPNLSRLAPKKSKKSAPKPIGERADPLKANVRFHKLQMAAHAAACARVTVARVLRACRYDPAAEAA